MKRLILAASFALAVVVPGVADASPSSEAVSYGRAYVHAAHAFGMSAVGCRLIGVHATCHGHATDAQIQQSTAVLQRMFAPPPAPVRYSAPAPTATTSSYTHSSYTSHSTSYSDSSSGGGGYSDVPGVPAGFAACVATRESSNGAGSSNIYGILGGGGEGSVADQKAAFAHMYAESGTSPWSRYDGC